jgi:hypothetical protein
MASRLQVRQELLRRVLGPGAYHTGTAETSSAVGTLAVANDAELRSSLLDATAWQSAWIYRPDATSTSDRLRQATGFDNAGTLNPAYNWTNAPSGEAYELIHNILLTPYEVHRAIERGLRRMYHEVVEPLSLVTDAGMEATGTGDWTASGATLAKDTDAGDSPEFGAQSLSVATTAADGYAQSASFRVAGTRTYHVWTDARAPAATARVRAIDVTNSNNSLGTDTWTHGEWGTIAFSFSPASDTDEVAIRLGADESGATVHFDNCIVLESGRYVYDLPSWLINPRQWIYEVLAASFTLGPRRRTLRARKYNVIQAERAANPRQVHLGASVEPLFVRALRPFLSDTGVLSSESTDTPADLNWMVTCAEVQIYDILRASENPQNATLYESRYQRALIDKRALDGSFMPTRPPQIY